MKIRISIDPDVREGIERHALRHALELDRAVNELLRAPIDRPGFVVKSKSFGQPLMPIDLDRISSVLEDLDKTEGPRN